MKLATYLALTGYVSAFTQTAVDTTKCDGALDRQNREANAVIDAGNAFED